MFIPLGTDRGPAGTPVVTATLVVMNLSIYVGLFVLERLGGPSVEGVIDAFAFDSRSPKPWTLVTSAFLHDPHGISHVVFNMIFLWVFGAAVESRLGRIGFTAFYLVGAVVAACAQWALAALMGQPVSMIGASGAVAACSGAFLALFPRARIRVLVFFILIGIWNIPAAFFILLYFALDLFSQLAEFATSRGSGGGVAYAAHIGGTLFGLTTGIVLLATGILPRTEFDLFYLFKQSRRRAAMRAATSGAAGPWMSATADTGSRLEKTRRKREPSDPSRDERLRIARHLDSNRFDEAASAYAAALDRFPDLTLDENRQIDLANRLYRAGDHPHAARAYELLLEHYPHQRDADGARLLLATIRTRHVPDHQAARALLDEVEPRLDEASRAHAETLRSELEAGSTHGQPAE